MARSGDEGFEQRLDRWVEAGRQFVDGVSGARPGSRAGSRSGPRRGGSRLNPAELGRWVENKLEWLLDDEGAEDWREPWQEPRQPLRQPPLSQERRPARRRPLEAKSRRGSGSAAGPTPVLQADEADWPSDSSFSVNRWQRPSPAQGGLAESTDSRAVPDGGSRGGPAGTRPLPRSTRRR